MMTNYIHAQHTVYHHNYHIVWITKYRYKVLQGTLRIRIREIIAQVAYEMHIKIINGVLSSNHIHLFVSIPPHITVSQFVQKAKGRSSRKIQQEFPEIKKSYWGRHFWGRGYFSSTSGNVTDEMINAYIDGHVDAHRSENVNNISLE
jgi:putative transposase